MTDAELLAVNVYCEAGSEIPEGQAAIARIVRNRMACKYESDGTVAGTILKKDQFSWLWFAFVNGKYTRISDTVAQAESIAEYKLKTAPHAALAKCESIAAQVESNSFHGPLYDKLTDTVVLYLNPKIVSKLPAWADPAKLVCTIGAHDFFHA